MSDVFVDSEGRQWELSLNFGDVKRVRKLLGINLASMTDRQYRQEDLNNLSIDEMPIFMRLQADPLIMVDVLFALVEPQANERGVTDESFGASITPATFKQATEIFWRLYHDFFLQAGESMKAKMIEGLMRYSGAVDDVTDQVDKKIEEVIENVFQQVQKS